MELAKNLTQWRDQTPEQWVVQAGRFLPPIAVAALVVLIAFQASNLTWALLKQPAEQDLLPPLTVASGSPSNTESFASIGSAYGLFGEAPEPDQLFPAVDPNAAPETTLDLTLTGRLTAQELPEPGSTVIPEAGAAIIAVGRANQATYWTGMTIEGANGAVLEGVFTDRILLRERDGRITRLTYDPDKAREATQLLNSRVDSRAAQARSTGQVSVSTAPSAAADLADAIASTAMTLGQYMSIEPHIEDGQTIGYRVQPIGDSDVFAELGFEAGDVLMEINGLRVNDVRNSRAVLQALTESNMAEIRLRRNGNDQILNVDTRQIQQLGNALQ